MTKNGALTGAELRESTALGPMWNALTCGVPIFSSEGNKNDLFLSETVEPDPKGTLLNTPQWTNG